MELLNNSLLKLGAERKRILAKVFGGAHVIEDIDETWSPGVKNADFVMEFLRVERIQVVSRDTGGANPRRIHFHTHTGDVMLKRVPLFHRGRIMRQETVYRDRILKEAGQGGEVILFQDWNHDPVSGFWVMATRLAEDAGLKQGRIEAKGRGVDGGSEESRMGGGRRKHRSRSGC